MTASSLTGIRIAYTFLPIVGVVGAIWIMLGYDISEERAEEVRRQLAERKGAAKG